MVFLLLVFFDMKDFLKKLWFSPKDNTKGIYVKKYNNSYDYILEVDFEKELFNYWDKIKLESKTTSNFSQSENWVVLECVDRLLEKWYNPKDLVLEKTYKLGHINKWRLDILVKKEWKTFLMIECKTWGKEFEKELKNMWKDWGQLFSYFKQDIDAEFLILYASNIESKWEIEYKNEIIKIEDAYRETSNVADFYDRWNKLTKNNWIFDKWIEAYKFESRALTLNDLNDIKEEDASYIFNRFLEILRHNTVSDKPNAFNKIFTLFLCKIYDEWHKRPTDELAFQWIEWVDNHVKFQMKLTDLYKKWMKKLLEKDVTDFSNQEFEDQFWWLIADPEQKQKLLERIMELRLQKNNEFAIKEVFDKETFLDNAKVLKEVVELLQNYKIRYTKKQPFLWDFFELLLTTWLKQEAGQFFTPVPIARFICKSIPIKKIIDEKLEIWDSRNLLPVTIDYASWSGHFLTESMEEIQNILSNISKDDLRPDVAKDLKSWEWNFDWAYDYMYWIEKDYRLVKTAKVWCFLHGDWIANVIHGDWLDNFESSKSYRWKLKEFNKNDKSQNEAFDLVLSNPPYSVSSFKWNMKKELAEKDFKLFNSLTDNSSEIEALFIERTSQLLKEGWIAWIILPSSILSNTWIYTKAREIILRDFEIIAITELGSNTFMATWTNTVTLFLRKRNKFFADNLEVSVNKIFENKIDITLNWIENSISKYVSDVWEGISFEDYKTLLEKLPNENIKNHELFKDYENKIKSKNLLEEILEIEKEKLFYFVLSYSQKVVLVKSWNWKNEKEFLGYKFSTAKWSEWIHPIFWWRQIDECTKLFDPKNSENPDKVSTYIFDAFNWKYSREISEEMKNNIFRINLSDLIQLNELEKWNFNKKISLNSKKKVKIESKWETKQLWEICEVKIWWTPSRWNYDFWNNWNNLWLSISEIKWWIILDTKEKINELGIKKSNVKLIKKWTTLLSFKLSIWKTAIAWKDLYTNEAIAWLCLENEEKVLNRYLFSLFNSKFIDLEKWNFNTFWKSLNSSFLKNEVFIPLPPKDIQQKIVDEIWELEKFEEKNNDKWGDLENSIKNIILESDWENKKFYEVLELISWQSPRSEYYNNIWKWLSFYQWKKDYWDDYLKEPTTWTEKTTKISIKNDILMSVRAPVWDVNLNNFDEICIWRGLSALRPFDILNYKFLYYYLKFNQDIIVWKQWVWFESISRDEILNLKILLPSLKIQKKIVAEIEVLEKEIEKLKEENNSIPEKKKEILKKYL